MRQRVKIPTRWSGARLGFSMSGVGAVSAEQAAWNLPAIISVPQGGNVPLRQYALNSDGWSIVVSNLPAGVTYNSGLERLEGAATGTSAGTVIFTLTRVGGSDVVDTAVVALVSGYDLTAALASLPFTVNLPTAPTITSEATVTNVSELLASVAVNGRRTIVTAGDYVTGLSITGSDKEIVFQSGARLTPTGAEAIAIGATRIKFVGQQEEHAIGGLQLNSSSDLHFKDFDVDATRAVSEWQDSIEAASPSRVLIEGCIWRAHRYAAYWATPFDVVFANSRLHGGIGGGSQATVRFAGGGGRIVGVDSLFQNDGAHHRFRVHDAASNLYLARCHFDSGNGLWIAPQTVDLPSSGNIEDVWLYDNNFYNCSIVWGHPPTISAVGRVLRVRADGNQQYTVGGGGQFISQIDPSWTIGSNLNMNTTTAVSWSRQ